MSRPQATPCYFTVEIWERLCHGRHLGKLRTRVRQGGSTGQPDDGGEVWPTPSDSPLPSGRLLCASALLFVCRSGEGGFGRNPRSAPFGATATTPGRASGLAGGPLP